MQVLQGQEIRADVLSSRCDWATNQERLQLGATFTIPLFSSVKCRQNFTTGSIPSIKQNNRCEGCRALGKAMQTQWNIFILPKYDG